MILYTVVAVGQEEVAVWFLQADQRSAGIPYHLTSSRDWLASNVTDWLRH